MKKIFRLGILSAFALASVAAHSETYALMLGINDYPEPMGSDGKPLKDDKGNLVSNDLHGAVNDVKNYHDLLVNKFGVKAENIKLITDGKVTKDAFTSGMQWILSTAKAGDQIFFVYSGHGTQFDDESEEDKKQEAIVLADGTLVTGSLFHEVSQITNKAGINAAFVFDSCYSGGMTRETASFDAKPATARKKFLEPKFLVRGKRYSNKEGNALKAIPKAAPQADGGSYVFLLAGREDQTTSDLEFKDPSVPSRGLFSLVFGALLEDNLDAPVESLMKATVDLLKKKGFEQVPQMELSSADRGKKPFFIK